MTKSASMNAHDCPNKIMYEYSLSFLWFAFDAINIRNAIISERHSSDQRARQICTHIEKSCIGCIDSPVNAPHTSPKYSLITALTNGIQKYIGMDHTIHYKLWHDPQMNTIKHMPHNMKCSNFCLIIKWNPMMPKNIMMIIPVNKMNEYSRDGWTNEK